MPPTTLCAVCAGALPDNASFCPTCGTPTPSSTARATGASTYAPAGQEQLAAERRRGLQQAIGDSCEVRELIGRGGFAEVYSGWDVRLKREVAIKTLRSDVSSPSLLERFQREAEAVAKLRHPHIIPIYSVGEHHGVAFFTMPRISGESLAAALEREKRLTVSEACRILSEAAGALEEAHRAGVVHRDVKPENIMLEGRDRRALVMDFGIAKNTESGEQNLTGTGMVMGTPQYMSPEQAAGDRTIDHRTDQYSLAMIGYRMLTGRLPFESASVQTLLVQQVTQQPPPLRSLAPNVPEQVAATIERALSKDPDDRFPSLADFAGALSAARDVPQVGIAPRREAPTLSDRVARMRALLPGWTHPLTVAAAAAAIAVAVIGPRTTPATVLDTAAQRDEAVFVARAHLADRGLAGPFTMNVDTETRDDVYAFLHGAIGGDSLASLARSGVPIWLWHIRAKPDSGPTYHVDVATGGRITRFEEPVRDSVTAPTVSAQVAESLAVTELVARGWNLASLVRRPDSVVTLRNRADRYLSWRRGDIAIPGARGDTAFDVLRVRVSGDRVTDYSEGLNEPNSWRRSTPPQWLDVIAVIAWVLAATLAGYSVILAIARQRHDALQWRPALVLALAILACMGLAMLPSLITRLQVASSVLSEVLSAVGIALTVSLGVVPMVVFTYVSGESLATERGLRLMDGVPDSARGQLTPELAIGAGVGAAVGLILAALEANGTFLSQRVFGVMPDPTLSSMFRWSAPYNELELMLPVAVLLAVAGCYVQSLIWRWKQSVVLVVLVPALLLTGMMIGADDVSYANKVIGLLTLLAMTLVTWRYGLMAGALTFFVSEGVIPLTLLVAARGVASAALVYAVALVTPFVLGRVAYRRFART